jgi:hypothetical protein
MILTGEFNHAGVDESNTEAMEQAWNAWISDLALAGFEPDENPIRWSATSQTFRLHVIEHSRIKHELDYGVHA